MREAKSACMRYFKGVWGRDCGSSKDLAALVVVQDENEDVAKNRGEGDGFKNFG